MLHLTVGEYICGIIFIGFVLELTMQGIVSDIKSRAFWTQLLVLICLSFAYAPAGDTYSIIGAGVYTGIGMIGTATVRWLRTSP